MITNTIFLRVLLFALLIFTPHAYSQNRNLTVHRQAVVFLGELDANGNPQYRATGFLIYVDQIFHLVTAKHVVLEPRNGGFTTNFLDNNMYVFFNEKSGQLGSRSISGVKTQYGVNWIFHDSDKVDIAVIPFAIDTSKDDIRVIPETEFLTSDSLSELFDVYFMSFQPGVLSTAHISPVVRTGTISLFLTDRTFYVDAFAFPGNSGSPVFLKPSLLGFIPFVGGRENKFVGIVGEYLPYQEIAISTQTLKPRVIFEENTGLARVWSVEYIEQIIHSAPFMSQVRRLKQ
jgi:hypothetical protein